MQHAAASGSPAPSLSTLFTCPSSMDDWTRRHQGTRQTRFQVQVNLFILQQEFPAPWHPTARLRCTRETRFPDVASLCYISMIFVQGRTVGGYAPSFVSIKPTTTKTFNGILKIP